MENNNNYHLLSDIQTIRNAKYVSFDLPTYFVYHFYIGKSRAKQTSTDLTSLIALRIITTFPYPKIKKGVQTHEKLFGLAVSGPFYFVQKTNVVNRPDEQHISVLICVGFKFYLIFYFILKFLLFLFTAIFSSCLH